jgi:hypothetical protein
MQTIQARDKVSVMAGLALVSWVGMLVHNLVELPDLAWYRPEYVFPSLFSLLLFVGWWKAPGRDVWGWLMFAWAGMHLVIGAVLSVLPLAIWPFVPEQSLGHYLSHVIYGLAQIPLLWALWRNRG